MYKVDSERIPHSTEAINVPSQINEITDPDKSTKYTDESTRDPVESTSGTTSGVDKQILIQY